MLLWTVLIAVVKLDFVSSESKRALINQRKGGSDEKGKQGSPSREQEGEWKVKIECSGPSGETFEGEAIFLDLGAHGKVDESFKRALEHNALEREALLKALDVWANVCLKALESEKVEP